MPAHLAYGYDLELALGIGRGTVTGRWDDPGARWDVTAWDDPDTSLGDWVDVTCDVPGMVSFAAGSEASVGATVQWEAATCAFSLDGPRWDPWNGPYAGVVGPATPVRWRWRLTGATDWEPLFTGFVQDSGWQWDPRTLTAAVACTDATATLAAYDATAVPFVGAGELAAARVDRILNLASWPADQRDITPGGVALVSTNLDGKVLEQLQLVADTDLALMWIRRDGRLAYRPQGRVNPGPAGGRLVVCPDDPDDVQLVDLEGADTFALVNVAAVRGGPVNGDDATAPPYTAVDDGASIGRFGARKVTLDLVHDATARPDWSQIVAQIVVQSQAWPSMAPRQATLGIVSGDPRVPSLLWGLEPDTTFHVVDTGGRVWVCAVAGWDVDVSFTDCSGVLQLSDITAVTGGMWDAARWDSDRWGLGMVA